MRDGRRGRRSPPAGAGSAEATWREASARGGDSDRAGPGPARREERPRPGCSGPHVGGAQTRGDGGAEEESGAWDLRFPGAVDAQVRGAAGSGSRPPPAALVGTRRGTAPVGRPAENAAPQYRQSADVASITRGTRPAGLRPPVRVHGRRLPPDVDRPVPLQGPGEFTEPGQRPRSSGMGRSGVAWPDAAGNGPRRPQSCSGHIPLPLIRGGLSGLFKTSSGANAGRVLSTRWLLPGAGDSALPPRAGCRVRRPQSCSPSGPRSSQALSMRLAQTYIPVKVGPRQNAAAPPPNMGPDTGSRLACRWGRSKDGNSASSCPRAGRPRRPAALRDGAGRGSPGLGSGNEGPPCCQPRATRSCRSGRASGEVASRHHGHLRPWPPVAVARLSSPGQRWTARPPPPPLPCGRSPSRPENGAAQSAHALGRRGGVSRPQRRPGRSCDLSLVWFTPSSRGRFRFPSEAPQVSRGRPGVRVPAPPGGLEGVRRRPCLSRAVTASGRNDGDVTEAASCARSVLLSVVILLSLSLPRFKPVLLYDGSRFYRMTLCFTNPRSVHMCLSSLPYHIFNCSDSTVTSSPSLSSQKIKNRATLEMAAMPVRLTWGLYI